METSEYIDNISSGNAINNEGGATFENTGSDTVSTGLVPFNNQGGIVSATAGTLNITGGGTDTGGTFNPSTGATINLNNSGTAPTLTGTYSGSGGGTVGLPAGTIDIGTAGATFNFPTGLFNWSGGTIQGNGAGNVLTNTGTITLTSSGAKTLYDGLIVSNGGAIVDSGTDDWAFDDSAVLNNLSGGLVNMASSESIENISSGNAINNEPGATFENTGNDTISTGAVPFNNQAGATVPSNPRHVESHRRGDRHRRHVQRIDGRDDQPEYRQRNRANSDRHLHRQWWWNGRIAVGHHRHRRRRSHVQFPCGLVQLVRWHDPRQRIQ